MSFCESKSSVRILAAGGVVSVLLHWVKCFVEQDSSNILGRKAYE
jgi:hypothetical protein